MDAHREKLLEALRPFAEAYERMRSYDEHEPADEARLMADDGSFYELLCSGETEPVTVRHLKGAFEALAFEDAPAEASKPIVKVTFEWRQNDKSVPTDCFVGNCCVGSVWPVYTVAHTRWMLRSMFYSRREYVPRTSEEIARESVEDEAIDAIQGMLGNAVQVERS